MEVNKGVVFTIDALLALSIFIAASIGFYEFFSQTTTFSSSGANVYTHVDNYISAFDNSEELSKIYREYQINSTNALILFTQLMNETDYPTNAEFLVWNGTNFIKIMNVTNYNFDEKFLIRRYLVLSVTEGLGNKSGNITVRAPSSLPGRDILVGVNVHNPTSSQLNVTLRVEDKDGSNVGWNISPSNYLIVSDSNLSFNVTIPEDAVVDEYKVIANATGTGFSEEDYDNFNVIKYGMIVVEAHSR